MLIVNSHNAIPIRLSDERWQHIVRRHPELASQRERVLETVAEPETIQEGDFGELLAIRFYPQTPLTNKFLVVAYREASSSDGCVVTAYFARLRSERRKTLWKQ